MNQYPPDILSNLFLPRVGGQGGVTLEPLGSSKDSEGNHGKTEHCEEVGVLQKKEQKLYLLQTFP